MDKKRLEFYKKKLVARREELLKSIARTEEEGRAADDDPTVDMADKAANSYTKEFLFGQTNTERSLLADRRRAGPHQEHLVRNVHELPGGIAAKTRGCRALGAPLRQLPGKNGARPALSRARPESVRPARARLISR